jgi:hypothetical protein
MRHHSREINWVQDKKEDCSFCCLQDLDATSIVFKNKTVCAQYMCLFFIQDRTVKLQDLRFHNLISPPPHPVCIDSHCQIHCYVAFFLITHQWPPHVSCMSLGGQVAQSVARRILLLTTFFGKSLGGSNPTVSSLVDRSECINWSRVGIRDCCARNMPKHTTQYTGPHHMHSCIIWLLREGTKKPQAYVLTLKSSNQVIVLFVANCTLLVNREL